MAKAGCTLVCLLLLFLITFAQDGLGQGTNVIGSIHFFNSASNDISIHSTRRFDDGTITTDPASRILNVHTAFDFVVLEGMNCMLTSFYMPVEGKTYSQLIVDWCLEPTTMPVPCLPDCWWTVDDIGFKVADSEYTPQTFVKSWTGPFIPSVAD